VTFFRHSTSLLVAKSWHLSNKNVGVQKFELTISQKSLCHKKAQKAQIDSADFELFVLLCG
jgi:hypothetical protein